MNSLALFELFDKDFNSFLPRKATNSPQTANWSSYRWQDYRLDETDDGVTIEIELPGCSRQDCTVEVRDRIVKITAQYREQDRDWSFWLGQLYSPDGVTATLQDGLLTISVPKTPDAKPRQIEIG